MNKCEIRDHMPGYFDAAVQTVASVINAEEMNVVFQPEIGMQSEWYFTAKVYPEFGDSILRLGNAFARVKQTRVENPKTISQHFGHFEHVDDPYAQELLTTVLTARMSPTAGYVNGDISPQGITADGRRFTIEKRLAGTRCKAADSETGNRSHIDR